MNGEQKLAVVESHLQEVMKILGIEESHDNQRTPYRIAKMWCNEVFASKDIPLLDFVDGLTSFPAPSDSPVTVKDIPFSSMCEHHWLPFFGKVDVMYVPNDNIIGLSKIPRIVKYASKKPQVQERLTKEIGNILRLAVNPREVVVRVHDVFHSCVSCRGVESYSTTDTEWRWKK